MSIGKRNEGNLKEQIYAKIFEDIIRGEYGPEDVLREKALVEKFHVSKSPVREALIELCKEGVLRSIPRYGYEVLRISDSDVEEIRGYRLILECGCLEAYWHMLTPERVVELQDVLNREYKENIQRDVLEHWSRNMDFHLALMSCYGNQYLYRDLEAALRVMTRAYAQFFWDRWRKTVIFSAADLHHKLLRSIRDGNREEALDCMREDISGFDAEGV